MEETLKEIEKYIKKARNYQIKAQEAEYKVFELINLLGLNGLDGVETGAENAGDLESAITTYIAFGEYTVKDIIRELKEQIK